MKCKFKNYMLLFIFLAFGLHLQAQDRPVFTTVDFSRHLQEWDGFGVNYVEVAQTQDYERWTQEYGGFSLLSEQERQEILQMIFGANGLKPSIIKMFFDPFHQEEPGAEFDHETTTEWMRYFVRQGMDISAERGQDIEIITTLYGPPAWATKQRILRGRDLDMDQKEELANYMIDWVKFLTEKEKFPVKYLSLHNEGDAPNRWPIDGKTGNLGTGHDYNAFWRPVQVADFIAFMRPMMDRTGLNDVGITPGETTRWKNFSSHWYHWAIHDNPGAMDNIGLVTSHGFGSSEEIISDGIDLLRLKRPGLHAWTTSMTWGKKHTTNYMFADLIRMNIYQAKVNAVIPWACIQTDTWVGGDPNPGTAFFVNADSTYDIKPQYYYYKQLTTAGFPGMTVAPVMTTRNSDIDLIAFSGNGTEHPDAFIVLNTGGDHKNVMVKVNGTGSDAFRVFRTCEATRDMYSDQGVLEIVNGYIEYTAPGGSVTTFYAE